MICIFEQYNLIVNKNFKKNVLKSSSKMPSCNELLTSNLDNLNLQKRI